MANDLFRATALARCFLVPLHNLRGQVFGDILHTYPSRLITSCVQPPLFLDHEPVPCYLRWP